MATTSDQIQGKDTTLVLFVNGRPTRGITVRNFEWSAIQDAREREVIGEPRTQFQLLIHGYKGTFEVDVASFIDHEITDFLNLSDKSGAPVYQLAVQHTENYRDGSRKRYRFVDLTLMVPETRNQGRKDDVMRKYEWRASDLVYLN
jgi:hypothetical protein